VTPSVSAQGGTNPIDATDFSVVCEWITVGQNCVTQSIGPHCITCYILYQKWIFIFHNES